MERSASLESRKRRRDESKNEKQPAYLVMYRGSQKHHRGHYGHHGHYGLYNQGATCYLNSLVQVLFVTTEIHDRLNPNSELDQELRNIFDHLKKTTSETKNITEVLGIEDVFTQQDAPECLKLILHEMSPGASEIFQGKLARTTKCSEGHIISEERNLFWTLPLSLEDTDDSLERSFESFFQKKVFTRDNQVYCNECNIKTDAKSECEMVESPQILTLILKRFNFDFNTMSYVKSHCCVEVPCELMTKDKKYKLYGMVNHSGGLYGGHYTATVLSNEDQTWYECNDSHVYKVQEEPFAKPGTYKSNTVYLLMYRAKEPQMPRDDKTEGLTDNKLHKPDTTQNVNDVRPDNTEQNQNPGKKDIDNKKRRKMGQNEEDDAERRREKASSVQTGEEEVNKRRKRVENEISKRERNNDINMSTGINCAASNEEESRRDEEAREGKSKNEDSTHFNITPSHHAAVNSGDKFKDSSEQPLNKEAETKDQKQKLNERNTFPVGTGGDKMKPKRDEEKTQEGHSEKDDRQKETDLFSYFSTSLPTEGEIGKNVTSNKQTSPLEGLTTDDNCATLSGRKTSEKGKKRKNRSKTKVSHNQQETLLQEPPGRGRRLKAQHVCCVLSWLVVIGLVIAIFLLLLLI